jgi:hypothetical protein
MLIEAAKLAPRWNAELALVYERAKQKGNRNRATLAVGLGDRALQSCTSMKYDYR